MSQNYRVLFVGDSTDAGHGAGGTPSAVTAVNDGSVAARANAIPARVAAALVAAGIPAAENSRFGTNGYVSAAALNEYDPRLVMNYNAGGTNTLGALSLVQTSTNSESAMTFAGVDRFDLYNFRIAVAGTLSILIDDVVVGTINQNTGVAGLVLDSFSSTLGTRTLKIRRTAGTARWVGVNAYNSAINSVQIINAGWRGATVADMIATGTPTSPLDAISVVNPHLTVIGPGINDYRTTGGTAAPDKATFKARLLTLVQTAKACQGGTAKVILRYPMPTSTTGVTLTLAQVREAYAEIAASENVPLLDTTAVTGSYATLNAAGQMFDTLHCKASPYDAVAVALAPMLRTALGI